MLLMRSFSSPALCLNPPHRPPLIIRWHKLCERLVGLKLLVERIEDHLEALVDALVDGLVAALVDARIETLDG